MQCIERMHERIMHVIFAMLPSKKIILSFKGGINLKG